MNVQLLRYSCCLREFFLWKEAHFKQHVWDLEFKVKDPLTLSYSKQEVIFWRAEALMILAVWLVKQDMSAYGDSELKPGLVKELVEKIPEMMAVPDGSRCLLNTMYAVYNPKAVPLKTQFPSPIMVTFLEPAGDSLEFQAGPDLRLVPAGCSRADSSEPRVPEERPAPPAE